MLFLVLTFTAPASGASPLSGMVHSADGQPVAGARAILEPLSSNYAMNLRLLNGEVAKPDGMSASTDALGQFHLEVPAAGSYRVRVEASGFVSMERLPQTVVEGSYLPPVRLLPNDPTTVTVDVPQGGPDVCLQATPAATSAEDDPWRTVVADGWHPAQRLVCPDAGNASTVTASTVTASTVTASTVTASTVTVRFQRAVGERLDVAAFFRGAAALYPRHLRGVTHDAHLSPRQPTGGGGSLAVYHPNGDPAADVVLCAGKDRWPVGRTDRDGRLDFSEPVTSPLEAHLLSPDGHRQLVSLPPGSGITEVRLAAAQATPGLVTDGDGRPLAGALVWPSWDPGDFTTTDDDGRFTLSPVSEAAAWIQAESPGFVAARTDRRPGPVHLRLVTSSSARGRVLDTRGRPVSGARIAARPLDRHPRAFALDRAYARALSDAEGRYTLTGLTPDVSYAVFGEQSGFVAARRVMGGLAAAARRTGIDLVLLAGRSAHGRVVTLEDKEGEEVERPVAGARVRVRPTQDPRDVLPPPKGTARSVTTDARGFFVIDEIPATTLNLAVQARGFAPMKVPGLDLEPEPQPGSTDLGTLVLVTAAKMRGVVTDHEGAALSGVKVWLRRRLERDPAIGLSWLEGVTPSAETDSDGRFVVDDLVPGEHLHLVLKARGFKPAFREAVEVPSPEPIAVALEPSAGLSGHVVDGTETGVAGVELSLVAALPPMGTIPERMPGQEGRQSTRTDENGFFAFDHLAAGELKLNATPTDFISPPPRTFTIAERQTIKDVEIVLAPGATLEGRITLEGDDTGVPGVFVRGGGKAARSDRDGRYRLLGLAAGEITVEMTHKVYSRIAETVELTDLGVEILDVELPRGRPVGGRMIDEDGRGIADVHVELEGHHGRDGHIYRTWSSEDGSFYFDEVTSGPYTLKARRLDYATREIQDAVTGAEAVEDLEVVLPGGAALVGRVLGLDYEALSTLTIEAEHEDGRIQAGTVDALGRYAVRDLEPGDWLLRASAARQRREATHRVAVPLGRREIERDVEFDTGFAVSGVVLLGGKPLAGANVSARGLDVALRRGVRSDHEGRFRIAGLPAGRYQVSATHSRELVMIDRNVALSGDTEVELAIETVGVDGQVVAAADGRPLAEARVKLQQLTGPERVKSSSTSFSAAADGTFVLPRLNAGIYRVNVRQDGYVAYQEEVELVAGSTPTSLHIALEAASGIELVVADEAGSRPPWVRAAFTDKAGNVVLSPYRKVDAEGRVRFPNLPRGHRRLLLSAPDVAPMEIEIDVPGRPSLWYFIRPGGCI